MSDKAAVKLAALFRKYVHPEFLDVWPDFAAGAVTEAYSPLVKAARDVVEQECCPAYDKACAVCGLAKALRSTVGKKKK